MIKEKVVKRYQNRKLYDTEESRYVTLNDIARMIQEGYDVKVVNAKTSEDLTALTLTQIIFEEEKRKKSILPIQALRKIIRSSGESVQELMEKLFVSTDHTVHQAREQIERYLQKLVRGGTLSVDQGSSLIQELWNNYQHTFSEWQKKVDQRLAQALDKVTKAPVIRSEIRTLEDKIAKLEEELVKVRSEREPQEEVGQEPYDDKKSAAE
jgi:polyhydroxyalkanoate synthesis repressor PhaR